MLCGYLLLDTELKKGWVRKMKKVLIFVDNFNVGGVTNVIISHYHNINKEKYHFDFVHQDCEPNKIDEEVLSKGSKVFTYHVPQMNPVPLLNYWLQEHKIVTEV